MGHAAVDQVPPQAVADLAFFAGTRDEVCQTLTDYANAGLTYASIVDYSGRIDPSLAQNARDNVEFLINELQSVPGVGDQCGFPTTRTYDATSDLGPGSMHRDNEQRLTR